MNPAKMLLAAFALAFTQTPFAASDLARFALEHQAERLGLSAADIADVEVTDQYRTRHNGIEHVWLRQRVDGLPVALALANVNIGSGGRIWSLNSRFAANTASRTASRQPVLSAHQALERYASERRLTMDESVSMASQRDGESYVFFGGAMADGDIPVHLAWLEHEGSLHLVWEMAVDEKGRPDWFNAWIDAHTGEVLKAVNWTQEAGYRVFAEPLEHPGQGPDTLVTDPADAQASPLGWHDTGTTQFTDTRGNNVFAQEDTAANNTGGRRPDGGVELIFDFPINLAEQQPPAYEDFAITNLFYWNNLIHDVLWHYGFDEPAGNFQQNNFGQGGLGNDAVRADAQDGSGTNNANFSTPPDGTPARMQMFVWTGSGGNQARLLIPQPFASAGDYTVAAASWGEPIGDPGTTAILELVDDGSNIPSEGCEPLQGFTAGNIALVRRGSCEFGLKGLRAQQAGASGVLVINNEPGNGTINMGAGGNGGLVTIPVGMIGQNNGNLIVADLANEPSGTLVSQGGEFLNRDSDLDAGVIAHEYGHGLSIRLTGGPATSSCLFGGEQGGEGWSDFLGLWLTAKASDTIDQPRGIGSYLIWQENIPGATIRPAPYIRDMSLNPLTYDRVRTAGQAGGVSVPHGVGTVFNSILWDLYWNLVEKYGFDEDFIGGSGGNNLTMQLVVDALKLQPCGPTFIDNRDATLLADQINNDGANQCEIWEAFARRGVGVNANDGGASTNLSGISEDFTLPAICESPDLNPGLSLTIEDELADDNGNGFADASETIDYTMTVTNTGNITLEGVTLTSVLPGDNEQGPACTPASPAVLGQGQVMVCNSQYTVSQNDIDAAKPIVNTVTVTAPDPTEPELQTIDAQAISSTPVVAANPVAVMIKTVNPTVFFAVGDVLEYSFEIENTGNVTLQGIILNDDLLGGTIDCDKSSLAPGESVDCGPVDYMVTGADVLAGEVLNSASISAMSPGGADVSAADAVSAREDRLLQDRFETK